MDNDEQEEYKTPPSSPVKQPVPPQLKEARSLKPSTRKLQVRQVFRLIPRLEDLQGCHQGPEHSFYVPEWNPDVLPGGEEFLATSLPRHNVQLLVDRLESVVRLFTDTFNVVEGIYIGKTIDLPSRFQKHRTKFSKPGSTMAMITLQHFALDDVPQQDRERWWFSVEDLALRYEKALTQAVRRKYTFLQQGRRHEAGGGGCAGEEVEEDTLGTALVYVLLSVHNVE